MEACVWYAIAPSYGSSRRPVAAEVVAGQAR